MIYSHLKMSLQSNYFSKLPYCNKCLNINVHWLEFASVRITFWCYWIWIMILLKIVKNIITNKINLKSQVPKTRICLVQYISIKD